MRPRGKKSIPLALPLKAIPLDDIATMLELDNLREEADNSLLAAVDEKSKAYQEKKNQAYTSYKNCHEKLNEYLESREGIDNLLSSANYKFIYDCEHPIVSSLYRAAKTVAEFYFCESNYAGAYPLYKMAVKIIEACSRRERKKILPAMLEIAKDRPVPEIKEHLHYLKYNGALCVLYVMQNLSGDAEKPYPIDEIDKVLDIFIDVLKNKKHEKNSLKIAIDHILNSRIMYGYANFPEGINGKYLRQVIKSLTHSQIKTFIKLPLTEKFTITDLLSCSELELTDKQIDLMKAYIQDRQQFYSNLFKRDETLFTLFPLQDEGDNSSNKRPIEEVDNPEMNKIFKKPKLLKKSVDSQKPLEDSEIFDELNLDILEENSVDLNFLPRGP